MEYNLGHHYCHRQHHGPPGEGHGHASYQQVSFLCISYFISLFLSSQIARIMDLPGRDMDMHAGFS